LQDIIRKGSRRNSKDAGNGVIPHLDLTHEKSRNRQAGYKALNEEELGEGGIHHTQREKLAKRTPVAEKLRKGPFVMFRGNVCRRRKGGRLGDSVHNGCSWFVSATRPGKGFFS